MFKKATFKDVKIVCASVPQSKTMGSTALSFFCKYAEKIFSDITLFTLPDTFAGLQQWFPLKEVFWS